MDILNVGSALGSVANKIAPAAADAKKAALARAQAAYATKTPAQTLAESQGQGVKVPAAPVSARGQIGAGGAVVPTQAQPTGISPEQQQANAVAAANRKGALARAQAAYATRTPEQNAAESQGQGAPAVDSKALELARAREHYATQTPAENLAESQGQGVKAAPGAVSTAQTPEDKAKEAAQGQYDVAIGQIDAQEAAALKQQQDAIRGEMAARGITDSGIIDEALRKAQNDVSTQFGTQRAAALSQKLAAGQKMAETEQVQKWQSSQNDFDRALTQQGLDQNSQKLAESAREFNSQQDFQRWATQGGWDQATIDRAWKGAMQAESEAATSGNISLQGNITAAAAQTKILNDNKVTYWQALGSSKTPLTAQQQQDMASDPIAQMAYQGGQGGQALTDLKTKADNLQKYQDTMITGLSNLIGTSQYAPALNELFSQFGITPQGQTAYTAQTVNVAAGTGFSTLHSGDTAAVAAGTVDSTGKAIPPGNYSTNVVAETGTDGNHYNTTYLQGADGTQYKVQSSMVEDLSGTWKTVKSTNDLGTVVPGNKVEVQPQQGTPLVDVKGQPVPAGDYTVQQDSEKRNGAWNEGLGKYDQVDTQITYLVDGSGNKIEVYNTKTGGARDGWHQAGDWVSGGKFNPYGNNFSMFGGNPNTIVNEGTKSALSLTLGNGGLSTGNNTADRTISYIVNPVGTGIQDLLKLFGW
jgi:hypothetical protein